MKKCKTTKKVLCKKQPIHIKLPMTVCKKEDVDISPQKSVGVVRKAVAFHKPSLSSLFSNYDNHITDFSEHCEINVAHTQSSSTHQSLLIHEKTHSCMSPTKMTYVNKVITPVRRISTLTLKISLSPISFKYEEEINDLLPSFTSSSIYYQVKAPKPSIDCVSLKNHVNKRISQKYSPIPKSVPTLQNIKIRINNSIPRAPSNVYGRINIFGDICYEFKISEYYSKVNKMKLKQIESIYKSIKGITLNRGDIRLSDKML
jgi:hypothetical protein